MNTQLEQGATCLSATRRLQRYLREKFQQHKLQQGAQTWPSPDILPWDAWLERNWREAALDGDGDGALLLNEEQELLLWEQVIADGTGGDSPLWRKSETARAARSAHRMMADWELSEKVLQNASADVRAFAGWRENFMHRCREKKWMDQVAMQNKTIARGKFGAVKLIAAGFDEVTPLMGKTLKRCGGEFKPFPQVQSSASLCAAADPEEELYRAASWCRELVEKHGADFSVGVVVRDLESRRENVRRVFTDVLSGFDPAVDNIQAGRMFHLSLGAPLATQPLVADALDLLEWTSGECGYETFSRWLRSPFTCGAAPEFAARARVDFKLRKSLSATITLSLLRRVAKDEKFMKKKFGGEVPLLCEMLQKLCSEEQKEKLPRSEWARKFSARLSGVNWPGDVTLDSHQHQALEAWKETLDHFASLDLLGGACDERAAFAQLRRLVSARVFNPAAEVAPVQVVGLTESAGLAFDALWSAGFSDTTWPPPPTPSAFLPAHVQRERGMARGGWDEALKNAQKLTNRIKTAAPTVVFSYAQQDEDRELRPSALLLRDDIAWGESLPAKFHLHPSHLGTALTEKIKDATGAPLASQTPAKGGASFFQDQSQCPFRAYARHRLGGEILPEARAAVDAMDRGTLVHRALSHLWENWRDRDALCAESDDALQSKIKSAVDTTLNNFQHNNPSVLGAAARRVLAEQLCELIFAHLIFEKTRPPFTINALEKKHEENFHGVNLQVRIDRVDCLADGSLLVMDYKTGDAKPSSWNGERPQEPQLPLYRALLGDAVKAIAFAKIRSGETDNTRLVGTCDANYDFGISPGRRNTAEWDPAEWDQHLRQLAEDIVSGKAAVDRAKGDATCRYCDLRAVCRVDEKLRRDGDDGKKRD